MADSLRRQETYAFPVRPAIRWRYHSPVEAPLEKFKGQNPPKGAIIHYWLKSKPKDPITLEIHDAEGKLVNKFSSKPEPEEVPEDHPEAREDRPKPPVLTTEVGVNRFAWNLQYRHPELVKGAKYDGGNPREGPLVVPGTYALKLTMDGNLATETV